jgi:hypothetical protein
MARKGKFGFAELREAQTNSRHARLLGYFIGIGSLRHFSSLPYVRASARRPASVIRIRATLIMRGPMAMREPGSGSHLPQSSSASRFTAGASGFSS